jgi:hypothetical protein
MLVHVGRVHRAASRSLPVPPTLPAPGTVFEHGLFDFTLGGCTPGSTVTFTITYPSALSGRAQYYKYGPTAADTTPHWYVMPATLSGNTVTLSITDGGWATTTSPRTARSSTRAVRVFRARRSCAGADARRMGQGAAVAADDGDGLRRVAPQGLKRFTTESTEHTEAFVPQTTAGSRSHFDQP